MSKHIKLFTQDNDYQNFKNSDDYIEPNIVHIIETDGLFYNYTVYPDVDDEIPNYFRFVAIEDSSILLSGTNIETEEPATDIDLSYSKDGKTWTQYEFTAIPLNAGETLYMKGNNPNGFSYMDMENGGGCVCFFGDPSGEGNGSTGKYECHGNIMSLLYGDDFEDKTTIPSAGCFYGLFLGCDGLLTAPELPATTLAETCYQYMFSGCTSLVTAPELPATTLSYQCYYGMFLSCTSLVTAPALPATTLTEYCYSGMFEGCTSLVNAPSLPATTLDIGCYYNMFNNCSSLVNAPELPATTLTEYCYSGMFEGCTSLVNAPSLPATTLDIDCYGNMFNNCTSLVTAPELPATTLAEGCYYNMFNNCSSLVNAPELPATTLAYNCYSGMFEGCTSLVTAPELPATTLADNCYGIMFKNCTSLVTAPELPATTLTVFCYYEMFQGCNNLNNITMLATDINAFNCLSDWVNGVASTGTFTKHENMTSLPNGADGIPSGWEIKDYIIQLTECTSLTITAEDVIGNDTTTTIYYTAICNGIDSKGKTVTGFVKEGTVISVEFPQNTSATETVERTITFEFMGVTASTTITQGVWVDYDKQYLSFKVLEDSTFKLIRNACQYSLNNGETWVSLYAETNTPTVPAGSKIMFKIANPSISNTYGIGTFSSTGKFNVRGNIMSLLYGDDFIGKTDLTGKNYAFSTLFRGCSNVLETHNLILPASTLAGYSYLNMFSGCTSLVTAPALPATTVANSCYARMFADCTSLVTAPALPATTVAGGCYSEMFQNCTSLINAPELPATILAENCYGNMFKSCTSLVNAPELPATTLAETCYQYMFSGCTSLVTAPELPATTLIGSCYSYMFNGCSKLNKITMLATNINVSGCFSNWVYGVASTGTFIKHKDVTSLPTGANGIPNGWTVQDYEN